MNIRRMSAAIHAVRDLSLTAREVTLKLPESLGFVPGAFVNVFMEHGGERMRRAYSISSDEDTQDMITLSIRKGSEGGMSERFWDRGIEQVPVEIMGPLGINTVDKIMGPKVFLFAFGIGVSVIKGILPHLLRRKDITEVTVMIASRNEHESLYRDFFEDLSGCDARLKVKMVLSRPSDTTYPFQGYLQDHLEGLDFTDASVYICGAKIAAESLKHAIEEKGSKAQVFFVEAFD